MRVGKLGGVLMGVPAVVVLFGLSFLVGLGIAADPGNIDTGMAAVLMMPVYALAAIVIVTAGLFELRRHPAWLRIAEGRGAVYWRALLLALAVSLTTGLGLFLSLYVLLNVVADRYWGEGVYLTIVAGAPLLVVVPSLATVVLFRWTHGLLQQGFSAGIVRHGLVGVLAGWLAYYPLLFLCTRIAINISQDNGYNTNVDSFMAGLLCAPVVAGPAFVLGVLGGRMGGGLTQGQEGVIRLLGALRAALGGVVATLLYLGPLTIAAVQEWSWYAS